MEALLVDLCTCENGLREGVATFLSLPGGGGGACQATEAVDSEYIFSLYSASSYVPRIMARVICASY